MASSSAAGRDTILQANTDARRLLKQALNLDEEGQVSQSTVLYQECCRVLLAGMSVDVKSVARDQTDVEHLSSMQQKMSRLFDNASRRLQSMESVVPTPQYTKDATDNAMQTSLLRRTEADLVLVLAEGVRMLSTRADGQVIEHQGPTPLKIFLIPSTNNEVASTGAPAFLQCASWVYPLIPGCSPIFKSSPHSYTFPDVNEHANPFGVSAGGSAQGMDFVTIVLRENVDRGLVAQLGQTLSTLANVQDHSGVSAMTSQGASTQSAAPPAYSSRDDSKSRAAIAQDPDALAVARVEPASGTVATPTWASKISSGISAGAGVASSVLSVTAQLAGKAVEAGSQELRNHMGPSENVEMSDATRTAVKGAKIASQAAVVVSDQVVSAVYSVAKILTTQFVPVAMEKISISGDGKPRDPQTQARLQGAMHVGAAGLDGVVQIYRSLEQAARHVGRGVHKATVETVTHRYGGSAGGVADESMSTVSNVVQASHNIDNVGIKALAKRTAMDAGRTGLASLSSQDAGQVRQQPGGPSARSLTYSDPIPRTR